MNDTGPILWIDDSDGLAEEASGPASRFRHTCGEPLRDGWVCGDCYGGY